MKTSISGMSQQLVLINLYNGRHVVIETCTLCIDLRVSVFRKGITHLGGHHYVGRPIGIQGQGLLRDRPHMHHFESIGCTYNALVTVFVTRFESSECQGHLGGRECGECAELPVFVFQVFCDEVCVVEHSGIVNQIRRPNLLLYSFQFGIIEYNKSFTLLDYCRV